MKPRSITEQLIPSKTFGWLALALLSSILALLGLKDLTQTQENSDDSKAVLPNILMIVADDLGYNDISSLNSNGIKTPAIDELAQNGVLFTRFYADSICAPSRVGLLTGREPERSGFRPGGLGIPEEFTTLPELLGNNGYTTKLVGKWHAGTAHRRSWPDQHGFQKWYGFLDQWQLQLPANSPRTGAKPSYWNPWLQRDSRPPEQETGHLSDILLEESLTFIRQNKDSDRPWFLYHAFLAPHHPIQPDDRFALKFPDTPQGRYRALVTQMDFSVGELIAELEKTADLDNTVVIFLSDNGGTNRHLDNNFPFKGAKAEVFEGSYRTPMLIHWPAQLKPQLLHSTVQNTDIYPSLVSAIGLTALESLDGRDLWADWLTANAHNREYTQHKYAGKVRIWETYYPELELMSFSALSEDGRWRLSYDLQRTVSLYDLSDDPSGYTDVAQAHPEVVDYLKREYIIASTQLAQLPISSANSDFRQINGFDQMRIADDQQQTIVFELLSPANADYAQDLINQPGDWTTTIDHDRRIHFNVGEYDISGAEPVPASCVVIGLTFSHTRPAFIGPKSGQTLIKLYQNGLFQDALELPMTLPRRHTWSATNITSNRVGQFRVFNKMAFGRGETPKIQSFETRSSPDDALKPTPIFYHPTLEELSQGLCLNEVL